MSSSFREDLGLPFILENTVNDTVKGTDNIALVQMH